MHNATALLVIDVQQSFQHRPYWNEAELPAFREAVLALITGCRAAGAPVVYILHQDDDPEFRPDSGLVKPMDWLPEEPDAVFVKTVHNAFTGTELGAWLAERGIDRLIVSGIRTEQCCETTTRVASDLGYRVDYVTAATLTFDMVHPTTGRVFSAAEIRERTELVLSGRFARIASVADALAALQEG
jgi:nicotinamidase-related amidase